MIRAESALPGCSRIRAEAGIDSARALLKFP
jgi:hypothetical protein